MVYYTQSRNPCRGAGLANLGTELSRYIFESTAQPASKFQVLCGIMGLNLAPVLIGTLPVAFLIFPTVLMGTFMYTSSLDEGNWSWTGTAMAIATVVRTRMNRTASVTSLILVPASMQVAGGVQTGSMVVAAYYLSKAIDEKKACFGIITKYSKEDDRYEINFPKCGLKKRHKGLALKEGTLQCVDVTPEGVCKMQKKEDGDKPKWTDSPDMSIADLEAAAKEDESAKNPNDEVQGNFKRELMNLVNREDDVSPLEVGTEVSVDELDKESPIDEEVVAEDAKLVAKQEAYAKVHQWAVRRRKSCPDA